MSTNENNQGPSFVQMAQSFAELTVKSAAAAITGQEIFVTEDEQKTRIEICRQCDKFVPISESCSECGCDLSMKTKFSAAYCPIGKWTGCPTIHG